MTQLMVTCIYKEVFVFDSVPQTLCDINLMKAAMQLAGAIVIFFTVQKLQMHKYIREGELAMYMGRGSKA